jgi:hypothetical protein
MEYQSFSPTFKNEAWMNNYNICYVDIKQLNARLSHTMY